MIHPSTKLTHLITTLVILLVAVGAAAEAASAESTLTVTARKPGRPATLRLNVVSDTTTNVPALTNGLTIPVSDLAFAPRAVPRCSGPIPSNKSGVNFNAIDMGPLCPTGSKIGRGSFLFYTGTPGNPPPPDFGTIPGSINIYNYVLSKRRPAFLFEAVTDTPVPNAHFYFLATVGENKQLKIPIPPMEELPPTVKGILSPPEAPRFFSLVRLEAKIKSPRPSGRRKPFATLPHSKKLTLPVIFNGP
jgi:hypothetical protein